MSETNEQETVESSATISVGEVLKTTREVRQLDIDDVCSYLRLSRRQVIALENNDFAVLPEATITRGFIRNYARMLEIDPEPLLEVYRGLSSTSQPRPLSIQSENIEISSNDKRSWMPYVLTSVLIVVLVAAWVIYIDYVPKAPVAVEYTPSETEQVMEAEVPIALHQEATSNTEETDAQVENLSDTTAPLPAIEQPLPAEQTVAANTNTTTASPGISGPVIKLKSTARSWVNITDRNNRPIFDKIMVAGVEEVVQGQPPFQVVIGNAPTTTLIYNEQTIDLAPVTKDRVARLKLE